MKTLKASDSYYGEFVTSRADTGAATDADTTPTATATKNGVDDATFTLTVTKIDTGRYKVTGTVPSYTAGDIVQISVAATVNSVAGKGVIDEFVTVTGRPGIDDIPIEDAVLAASQPSYAPSKEGDAMTLTAAYDAAKTASSQTSVNTIDDFLDTEVAAILADTNELQTDLANGGRLDLLVDAIKAKTDNLPASPAAVGSAMTITDSTTLNSIADAILKRDWTEITGEATRSLLNAARTLLNKWTLTTGSAGYVVKKEDDTTTAWTGTPTVDGNGNVSGMDHD